MGSGKSAMGRLLAERLGFGFIDLDQYIEGKYHKTIAQLFEAEGESSFRTKERSCLHEVAEFEKVVVATGGGAPCFFNSMEMLNSKGTTIYLKLSSLQLVERLLKGKAGVRPLIAGKTNEELLEFVQQTLEQRSRFYEQAKVVISGSDSEIAHQINAFQLPVDK